MWRRFRSIENQVVFVQISHLDLSCLCDLVGENPTTLGVFFPTFGIRAHVRSVEEETMAKKSADGEIGAATPSLKLSKTNYRVWSMTMEVYLGSHDLWQTIVGENPTKKKDRQALSAIMSGVPEELLGILDAKKTAKENWEILRQRNFGVDRVIQSRIQGLRRDLEVLTMGKAETVVDFAMKFTHLVSDLRNLGETMEEKEVVRRFL